LIDSEGKNKQISVAGTLNYKILDIPWKLIDFSYEIMLDSTGHHRRSVLNSTQQTVLTACLFEIHGFFLLALKIAICTLYPLRASGWFQA
jgi:hypothetical protein